MTVSRFFAVFGLCALAIASLLLVPHSSGAQAQNREVPYWASMRFDKVNMRVGPSQEYPIEWVYQRKRLPVKVVRLREGWRLIRDHEGTQGWVSESQLTRTRGALVIGEGAVDLRESPSTGSTLRWRAQPGVVGALLRCRETWCEIDVEGRTGWVQAVRLWGAGEP